MYKKVTAIQKSSRSVFFILFKITNFLKRNHNITKYTQLLNGKFTSVEKDIDIYATRKLKTYRAKKGYANLKNYYTYFALIQI